MDRFNKVTFSFEIRKKSERFVISLFFNNKVFNLHISKYEEAVNVD